MRLIKVDDWDSFYNDLGDSRNMRDSYDMGYTDALDRVDDWMDGQPTVDAVVLPCKLGTTLYRICEEGRGRKPFIREVTFNRTNFARIVLDNEVGRTVFLAREEAEAALAKMKGLEDDRGRFPRGAISE